MKPTRTCSVADCDTAHLARGLCSRHYKAQREYPSCDVQGCEFPARQTIYCYAHYNRFRRHGDPTVGGPLRRRAANGEGCITPDGYRAFVANGTRVYEHRAVMEQMIGRPLLPFENVHHKNGQRADNRPENLELWTKKQPYGQRVTDLIEFVATHYRVDVLAALQEKP